MLHLLVTVLDYCSPNAYIMPSPLLSVAQDMVEPTEKFTEELGEVMKCTGRVPSNQLISEDLDKKSLQVPREKK